MIRVQAAFLANAAQADSTGLISALGGFLDTVGGAELPIRAQIWVVGRLGVDRDDALEAHALAVTVEHSDGSEQVARIDIVLPAVSADAIRQLDPEMPVGAPITLPLALEFRRVGIYTVRILVDGDEVWSQPVRVMTTLPQL